MINLLLIVLLFNGITGKIQGTVKDEDTGMPISNADVVILNTEMGAATDDNGNFYILNVTPGKYIVEASCIGYQSKKFENVVAEIDQAVRLKVLLKQTAIEIEPITVISQTPIVKKDMVIPTSSQRRR